MPSFEDILNKTTSDVTAPPPYPAGTYLAVTEGVPVWGKSSVQQTKQIQFKAKLLQAMPDVNQEKLSEWAEQTGSPLIGSQSVYLTYYDPQPHRLTEFLSHLGLGSLTVREAIEESPGRQFIVTIRHRPSQDGTRIMAEVGGTASV
jgi:hypothetical protein